MGQTVNLLAQPSKVRILHSPTSGIQLLCAAFFIYSRVKQEYWKVWGVEGESTNGNTNVGSGGFEPFLRSGEIAQ